MLPRDQILIKTGALHGHGELVRRLPLHLYEPRIGPVSARIELGSRSIVPSRLSAQSDLIKQVNLNVSRIVLNVPVSALNRQGHRWDKATICGSLLSTLNVHYLNVVVDT